MTSHADTGSTLDAAPSAGAATGPTPLIEAELDRVTAAGAKKGIMPGNIVTRER